ncbi:hypothetical protein BLOT_012518 [Blomia tropicalis]|nr:hypothetical protein BLOT_012518 [Blomia tropicalis]
MSRTMSLSIIAVATGGQHRVYKHHPTEGEDRHSLLSDRHLQYAYWLLYFVFTSSLSSCNLTVARSFMVQTRSRLRKEMETKATTAAEALRPTKIPLQPISSAPLMQQPEPITIVREENVQRSKIQKS